MIEPKKPLRALIVEDSEDDAMLLIRELRQADYEPFYRRVETAADMATALDSANWDVIISDFSMPQFSGMAALALMKEKGLDLPFIIVSRVIGEETAVEALKAGAHDFVMKRNLARLAPALEREMREARVRREQVHAARALASSEARYRELADSLPVAVFETGESGVVKFLNQTGLELFGYSERELEKGINALAFFDPRERDRARDNAVRVSKGDWVGPNHYVAVRKSGETFPVLVHTSRILQGERTVGLRGVIVDVTEQHRVERERLRLATAVEQAAEAVVITDPGGMIEYVNPAFEAVTGYSPEEAMGKHADILVHGKRGGEVPKDFIEALKYGRLWSGRLSSTGRDGSHRDQECTLSPIRDNKGVITNLVVVCRDVTEQLKLERHFRQAQKLEALGTLAGGIAHDFNNILTPIIGYAQLLYDGIDGPVNSDQQKDLERIIGAGTRARELIDQIRAFSRDQEKELRPVHLVPLIKETLKLLKASLPATVEIRQVLDTDDDVVMADPIRLHQILVNLFTNAGLAMGDEPGVLEVSIDQQDVDAESALWNPEMKEGPYLRLSVSDTGCGMAPEVMERIFEPFFSTRADSGGTGLGLAAVHGIVKSFKGAVHVYSEKGRGSTFRIYLPQSDTEEAPGAAEQLPVQGGTETILFVDDEEEIAMLGKKLLEGLGYVVVTATCGRQALEILSASPERFDMLITDQTMPHMTGNTLIRLARQLRPDMPALIASGFSRNMTQEEIEKLGNVQVLSKPMTKRTLAEAIRRGVRKA